jgi:hypothetical protein
MGVRCIVDFSRGWTGELELGFRSGRTGTKIKREGKEGLEFYGEGADNGGERKDTACQKPVHVAAASFC